MSRVIDYDVSSAPTASTFINDWEHQLMGIRGPLGSGKSVACVIKILTHMQAMPKGKDGKRRSRWLVVRNTYRELEDTTIKTWLEWVPEDIFGPFRRQAKTHLISFNDVEAEVLFRSLDTDDDIRKILSLEISGAWFNEAREIGWVLIKNTRGRLGRYPVKKSIDYSEWITPPTAFGPDGKPLDGTAYWAGIILDTNSPDDDHWWYTLAETPENLCKDEKGNVVQEKLKDIKDNFIFYSQPGGLDPLAENRTNLPARYYEDMCIGADRDWINVYVNNEYGAIIEGKAVFPEYSDRIHCDPELGPVPGLIIVRAWDFGLTPACTFHQFTAKGQWLILDELGSTDSGIDRFSDLVFAKCGSEYMGYTFIDVGDPAGMQRAQTDEKTCFEIINKKLEDMYGDNYHPIEAGRQDPRLRLESVKKALNTMIDGFPGMVVSPKAKMTRKGLMGHYQYKKLRTSANRYQEKPDKNEYSHYLDSVQYAGTIFLGTSLTDHAYFDEDTEDVAFEEAASGTGRNQVTGY